MTFDYVFIGAGLQNLVLAEIAKSKNKKVLIIEKQNQIGGAWAPIGNYKDKISETCPHIVPNKKGVWEILKKANISGQKYNFAPKMEKKFLSMKLKFPLDYAYILHSPVYFVPIIFIKDVIQRIFKFDRQHEFRYFFPNLKKILEELNQQLQNDILLQKNVVDVVMSDNFMWNVLLDNGDSIKCKHIFCTPQAFPLNCSFFTSQRLVSSFSYIYKVSEQLYLDFDYLQFEHDDTLLDCIIVDRIQRETYLVTRLKRTKIATINEVRDNLAAALNISSGLISFGDKVEYTYLSGKLNKKNELKNIYCLDQDNISDMIIEGSLRLNESINKEANNK